MSPLDTPLTFRWPLSKAFAAKRELRGLGSVRQAAYGTLSDPEFTLRDWRRYQCAAGRCRAAAFRCEKLRFHQACTLGAPNAPVGPSLLDARPEGVASKGGSGVSRGEREPSVPCPLLSPPGDPGIPRPPKAANVRAHIERKPRLQRRTAVSAEVNPLLRVKKKGQAAVSAEPLTLC